MEIADRKLKFIKKCCKNILFYKTINLMDNQLQTTFTYEEEYKSSDRMGETFLAWRHRSFSKNTIVEHVECSRSTAHTTHQQLRIMNKHSGGSE